MTFNGRGKKNVYKCKKCGLLMYTVDRDEGVTPFTTECRTTLECHGMEDG